MIYKGQKYSLHKDVIVQKMDDEGLLVNMTSEEIFQLNETGAQVVEHLNNGLSFQEILDSLMQSYEVNFHNLEMEIMDLLNKLIDRGLIVKQ